MGQVSKYPISSEVYERIFDLFTETLSSFNTKKDIAKFLDDFLTPTEQVMLAKRYAIAFLLTKGYSYREISKILRVSISTIGFVSLDLKIGRSYRKVISRIMKNERTKESIDDMVSKVLSVLSAGGSKSGSWRSLKDEIENKKRKKVF
jgi:uncharacterized protein YerC